MRRFRTLSLASPSEFMEAASGLGVRNTCRPVFRRKGAGVPLSVHSARRLGNFQLIAALHYSKSPVFNCFIFCISELAGQPATARGSGTSVGATTGGLMQRRQGVCVSSSIRTASRLQSTALRSLTTVIMLCLLVLCCAATASAQVNTATLSGAVSDPQRLPVKGAKVTMTNAATGAQRTSVTDDGGRYNLVGLPPGQYKMTVDGGANFTVYHNASVVLTLGETATFDPHLKLKGMQ